MRAINVVIFCSGVASPRIDGLYSPLRLAPDLMRWSLSIMKQMPSDRPIRAAARLAPTASGMPLGMAAQTKSTSARLSTSSIATSPARRDMENAAAP
ncbi:hypothetical protein V474_05390 [Novosphingobium barchaimii LL02]|uniref:Uncharacterized protein n=1 Tax=Novosphingobium barchaimii LL02 TaxID=1114963 RepID=A0A0J7XIF9_9SPHN|nr:hypothetical protein V474_05390 [Novosphingobium barchaimii LL02]